MELQDDANERLIEVDDLLWWALKEGAERSALFEL